jgi:hypothetical protein
LLGSDLPTKSSAVDNLELVNTTLFNTTTSAMLEIALDKPNLDIYFEVSLLKEK